jgi:MtrB/PioB family decaheme-associated outer membrane protein
MIMKIPKQQFVFRKKILALLVLLAIGSAYADDDDVEKLTKNESSVSAGVGAATGDSKSRSIFGQYNGLRNDDTNLLLDINLVKLQDATGLWTKFEGYNLGLDNRELSFSQNKQGDWKYSVEYNEITHHDMRTINTGLQAAGTTTPTVVSLTTPGTGSDLNLQLQRQAVTLGAEKWITPNLLFETSFKNEDKNGARLSGEGITCSNGSVLSRYSCGGGVNVAGAMLMLPEPINSTTKQFEAKLNYSGEKFMVSGGYYGSFFTNANGSLDPSLSGSLYNPDGTTLNPTSTLASYLTAPIALPPDNQAQQLYVSGNYALTPTTHSTFKYAYTHATQNESFGSMGLTGAPSGVSNLGGVVDTNLAQLGLTARPMSKLTLLVNLRYEDKNDKTPLAAYNVANSPLTTPTTYTSGYSNSSNKLTGKLEANYQLPDHYRAILGVDYASVQRATPPSLTDAASSDLALALAGLREKTQELGYRAELRRSLSDTLNAAVSYGQSQRNGDNWTIYNPTDTFPMTMMDRKRDKVKVSADWMPTSNLSLQFNLEDGKDTYTGPTGSTEAGMRDTSMSSYGIDADLILSENWKLTGYVNQSDQTLHVNHSAAYLAELDNVNTSLGIGVICKPSSRLDVGGNLSYMNDSNRYNQSWSNGGALVGGGLPDVTYRVTSLKLFGKYSLEKNSDIRVDLIHQNAKLDEWTWGYNGTPFAYSDNTTVSMQPNQSVTFLGASYVYKFR